MQDIGNVLIIGSSASIGPLIVDEFANFASKVIATYNTRETTSEKPNVFLKKLDLLDSDSRLSLVKYITHEEGSVDVAVFIAGKIIGQQLDKYTDDQADNLMAVNFTAQALLIRDLLPVLAQGARILLVGSVSSERGSYDPIYAAGKGALIPFGKSLATAYGERMSVNIILPGPIEGSSMFDDMSSENQAKHRQQSPRKELLNQSDFARILVDLSQKHWRHANGSVLRVNGASYV